MAKKYLVGYCSKCGRETKHEKIECTESLAWRAFEVVATAGWGSYSTAAINVSAAFVAK